MNDDWVFVHFILIFELWNNRSKLYQLTYIHINCTEFCICILIYNNYISYHKISSLIFMLLHKDEYMLLIKCTKSYI